jgi:pyroglutamyl-peptidase
VDGDTFSKKQTQELWQDCPDQLKPTFDCEDVWRRWRSNMATTSPDADIRPSDDPGNFLCGFIYYFSMAWFWKKKATERPVMFLHVPDCPKPEDVAQGRDVALGLIRALVDSRDKVGIYEPMKPDGTGKADDMTDEATKERWSGK